METIKRNSRGNFEISGVEFNGDILKNNSFSGKCITEGWEHVMVVGDTLNNDELKFCEFIAYVDVHKGVYGDFTRDDMRKVHDALCGPFMFGPGWDWK